ncbi:MAG: hypothetical protein FJX80_06905 [Bacteroidetes bacterium]|nr:hypothetical protein [Bacteroidota bacterium]
MTFTDVLNALHKYSGSLDKIINDPNVPSADKTAAAETKKEVNKLYNDLVNNQAQLSTLYQTVIRDAQTTKTNSQQTTQAKVQNAAEEARIREENIIIKNNKNRQVQLNTYYGKRFMAQTGVLRIFIYTCIPILFLLILTKSELFPTYIAGILIIITILIGGIFIYLGIEDINKRDKVNFDEYAWEFDPSKVGDGKVSSGDTSFLLDASNCMNGVCCATGTEFRQGRCYVASTAAQVSSTSASRSSGSSSLMGDLAGT